MSKTTVIYHSADFDGIFCREIARKFLPEAELIGWNHGDPKIPLPTEGLVYILDLSPECLLEVPGSGFAAHRDCPECLVWIDHHKTAIEKFSPHLFGYRIDGVAACRLAWQWFAAGKHAGRGLAGSNEDLPNKEQFYLRQVQEPLAVRLAGEYDVWDKRDRGAETFQYALRVAEPGPELWERLLRNEAASENAVYELLPGGATAQRYQQKVDADLVTYRSYRLQWEGLNFIVLNTGRFNSLTFGALDNPATGHDALLGYMFNGKAWTVSLYHARHRTDLDLSEIAKKYGGGGHKGACGFTCAKLPFLPGESQI